MPERWQYRSGSSLFLSTLSVAVYFDFAAFTLCCCYMLSVPMQRLKAGMLGTSHFSQMNGDNFSCCRSLRRIAEITGLTIRLIAFWPIPAVFPNGQDVIRENSEVLESVWGESNAYWKRDRHQSDCKALSDAKTCSFNPDSFISFMDRSNGQGKREQTDGSRCIKAG